MKTFATLFSGGGVGCAALKGEVDFVFAVEKDPKLAAAYKTNISENITVADILTLDAHDFPRPDGLQISTPCTNASTANNDGGEKEIDILLAKKSCEFIKVLQPEAVIIENVRGYGKFKSFQMLVQTLLDLNYHIGMEIQHDMFDGLTFPKLPILNSADFGVPQTRERLILRARKSRPVPKLPRKIKWVGWYEAIEDLLPDLPDDQFADWQLKRLPEELKNCFVFDDRIGDSGKRWNTQNFNNPVWTIRANSNRFIKAFVIPGDNGSNTTGQCPARAFIIPGINMESKTLFFGDKPTYVVSASSGNQTTRAWLESGRVVKLSPRALARFQSIPDWYQLPENNQIACKVIGNGFPSIMARDLILPLLED